MNHSLGSRSSLLCRENMSEMLLTDIVTAEDTWSHVNRERLILFFIGSILDDNQLVVDPLSEVKLTAED